MGQTEFIVFFQSELNRVFNYTKLAKQSFKCYNSEQTGFHKRQYNHDLRAFQLFVSEGEGHHCHCMNTIFLFCYLL